MSDHKFDRLLSDIRNEAIDDRVVAEASDRVWNSLSASPSAQFSVQKLRSCEDFQALIPAYLEKALPEARGLLFQDHVHQCVACRRAVEQARRGEMQIVLQLSAQADRQTLNTDCRGSGIPGGPSPSTQPGGYHPRLR